jgi:Phosphotransferase enzyme family
VAKSSARKMVATNLLEHPAVTAWRALEPERFEPDGIEILKEKTGSRVYRLLGVGPAGTAVIAKQRRLRPGGLLVERTAFEEVFPRLPVPALRFYGFVKDEDARFGWLFVEDAGRCQYSAARDDHRVLAGRWLGYLHSQGPRTDPKGYLPAKPRGHSDSLRSARAAIVDGIANPVLTADDVEVLRSVLSLLDSLESRWAEVDELSDRLPDTVTLRNFAPRNSFVRTGDSGMHLVIVDCQSLAWGNPVCDLAQSCLPLYGRDFSANPDITAYYQVVRDHWPNIDLETLRRLASYATVVRCMTALGWEAPFLAMEWAAEPMCQMRAYHEILPHAMQAAGWSV